MTAVDEPPIIPMQPTQRYNLRECATHIINSVILEESPMSKTFKSELYSPTSIFAGVVIDPDTGRKLEYGDLDRLAQGKCSCKGTNTTFFIRKEDVPAGRKDTYGSIVVDYCLQKADPNCVRLVVSGDQVEYPFEFSTPTADLVTAKILTNSVIPTKGAKFWTIDIKNFYLNTLWR
eukprot:9466301-Ditylum_brightwellii.AAC.1